MEWQSALGGFVFGLLGSYLTLLVQRSWQRKASDVYSQNVIKSLVAEIEEGVGRAKYMVQLLGQDGVSFSRIYTALWQSTNERLASTLTGTETLELLHHIYYRFDLINFNCERDCAGSGGAFAKEYLPEIEENLSNLKALATNT